MSYVADYHVHTHFSADSQEQISHHIATAQKKGLQEICFTDHYEYNFPESAPNYTSKSWACDIAAMQKEIDQYQETSPVRLRKGIEMGLRLDEGIIEATVESIQPFDFDFILASVHFVNDIDPYFPEFFEGRPREETFALYLQTLLACLQKTDYYNSVGHIDFPSKGCPLAKAGLYYTDAPDELDSLFKHVIEHGKVIEINTSILKRAEARPRDLNLWKRYAELGAEAVTIGSDAHTHDMLTYKFDETLAFLKEAGIRYFVTFDKMQPTYHSI